MYVDARMVFCVRKFGVGRSATRTPSGWRENSGWTGGTKCNQVLDLPYLKFPFPLFSQHRAGLRCGRRGAFFGPTEDFNGFRGVSKEIGLESKMRSLFDAAREKAAPEKCLEAVTVFFEIYGGAYPHPEVAALKPRPKCVQTGVWYSPRRVCDSRRVYTESNIP